MTRERRSRRAIGTALLAALVASGAGGASTAPTAAAPPLSGEQRDALAELIADADRRATLVDRSPAQVAREDALRDLDAGAAVAALRDSFPAFAGATPERAIEAAGEEVVRYEGEQVARLRSRDGHRRVLLSTRPLRTPDAAGALAPVDLSLVDGGIEWTPVNAPFVARLGEDARRGFEIGPTPTASISVKPLDGAATAPPCAVAGGLMWANTHPDSDTIAAVVTDGVETFEQIRSAEAPERFRYQLGLRPGQTATLVDGGVEVVDAAGAPVVRVLPPAAADRNGRPVPAHLELAEDELSVVLAHRTEDYAYPVLLDPTWQSTYDWVNDPGTGNAGWNVEQTDGGGWYDVWAGNNGAWAGLFARPLGGRVYPPGTEVKLSVAAPGTTRIERAAWLRFTATNNRHRQTTRLALYGGPAPIENDYFSTWPGGEQAIVEQPADENAPPAMAKWAMLWMFTPPCGATERNCPRLVPTDGLTIAKVGALDMTLVDDDLPTALAQGLLRDMADTWSASAGPFPLTIGGSDPGAGVASYALRATDATGDHELHTQAVVCDPRHTTVAWGSNVCPGEQALPITVPGLPDGRVRLSVHATDLAGNGGESSWNVYLDRVRPALSADGPLVDLAGAWTRGRDPADVRLAATDAGAGVSTIRLVARTAVGEEVFEQVVRTCDPQRAVEQPCPAAPTARVPVPLDRMPAGTLAFEAVATDHLGHVSAPRTWTLRVDRTRPVVRATGPLVDAPRPARATSDTAPIPVTIAAKDTSSGSGVDTIALYADNDEGRHVIARGDACPTGDGCPTRAVETFQVDPTTLPEGRTTFYAVAQDAVGNRSEPTDDFDSFQDRTPPSAPTGLKVEPDGPTTLEVTWDRSVDTAPGSGVSHYQYRVRVDGQPSEWINVDAPRATLPNVPTATSVEVIVRALDFAENPSKYVRRTGRTPSPGSGGRAGEDDYRGDDDYGDGSGGGPGATASSSLNTQMAVRFRPLLRFDSSEYYRPLHPSIYLMKSPISVCRERCRFLTSLGMLSSSQYNRTDTRLNDRRGPRTDPGDHRTTSSGCELELRECEAQDGAIFYQVPEAVGPRMLMHVNYWIYYRFNDVPASQGMQIGKPDLLHEADWEGVTVALDREHPTTFVWIGFSAHGKLFRYQRGALRCGEQQRPCTSYGKRVNTYVSSGTHANYPFTCRATTPITCNQTDTSEDDGRRGLADGGHDGRRAWVLNDMGYALQRMPNARDSDWVDFRGNWNEDNDTVVASPAAPADNSNYRMYSAPWADARSTIRKDEDEHFPWARRSSVRAALPPVLDPARPPTLVPPPLAGPTTPAVAADCPSWNGPGIAASVCDPEPLVAALSTTPVARDGGPLVERGGNTVEGMPGLAQLPGAPLSAGERLTLRRVAETADVRVQATSARWSGTLRFAGVSASEDAPARLEVAAEPRASVVRLADGRVIAPARVVGATIPPSPRVGRVRRVGRRTTIAYVRARAERVVVELVRRCDARQPLEARTLRSRPGTLLAVRFRYDRRGRFVRAASLGADGTRSIGLSCGALR